MFDFLKKKDKGIEIGAPVKGKAVPISQVSDPTFGEEILGKGVAIRQMVRYTHRQTARSRCYLIRSMQ